jgi:regulator of sigma E protease
MTTLIATIIVLGVLIMVHELGHFFAAKSVGIRVERFSIGLGPRIFGFRRGETEYVLSLVPLGGYVKMGGMDDEVMEKIEGGAVEPRAPSPRDFDAKPLWARAFVISAGVIVNMLFAFVVYTAVIGIWGLPEPRSTRLGLVNESSLPAGTEALATLPIGGEIVRVGARTVESWGDVTEALIEAPAGPTEITTRGPASSVNVVLPEDEAQRAAIVGSLRYWLDAGVGGVEPGLPADRADLRAGDRILSVNGSAVTSWDDFVEEIQSRPEEPVELLIERDGVRLTARLTPERATDVDPATGAERTIGKIGVYPARGELAYQDVGPIEAVQYGALTTLGTTRMILGFLGQLVTGNISPRSVGSIVTIGEASGQAAQAGIEMFLQFIALFSINLAVLNLLPIPVLDGGHLLFLLIEGVRGRALSVEQRVRWMNVGFMILLGIMLLALSNDVLRLLNL